MFYKEVILLVLLLLIFLNIMMKKNLLQVLILIEFSSLLVLGLIIGSAGVSWGVMLFIFCFMVMEAMVFLSGFYFSIRYSGAVKSKMVLA